MPVIKLASNTVVTGPATYVAQTVVTGPATYFVEPTVVTGPAAYVTQRPALGFVPDPAFWQKPVVTTDESTYILNPPVIVNAAKPTVVVGPAAYIVDNSSSSIGDKVFLDANRNGAQDAGESGIAGQTVRLYRAGKDGVFATADDVLVATKVTDAAGNYKFTGLAGDKYQVAIAPTAGYSFTKQDAANDNIDSDFGASGRSQTLHLSSFSAVTSLDAGLVKAADLHNASIGDRVWNDSNRNGIQDAREAGLASQHIMLTGAGQDKVFGTADDVVQATMSDANGHYAFTGLSAGDYKVEFSTWAISGAGVGGYGYRFTTAHAGNNPALDSNAEFPAQVIHLAAGEHNTSVDGGLQYFTIAASGGNTATPQPIMLATTATPLSNLLHGSDELLHSAFGPSASNAAQAAGSDLASHSSDTLRQLLAAMNAHNAAAA